MYRMTASVMFLLVIGCQRLDYEKPAGGGATAVSESTFGESESESESDPALDATSDPTASGDPTTTDPIPPESQPCGEFDCIEPNYCILGINRCECWGDDAFCEHYMFGPFCGAASSCEYLTGDERAACQLSSTCGDAGGAFVGEGLLCNNTASACKGTCDTDPSACDADGDGVPTFPCGPELACTRDQYCADGVGTDGPSCIDVPKSCIGLPLLQQQICVGDTFCPAPNWLDYHGHGHELTCHDDSETE
jgi:hypothetical protein